MIKIVIHFSAKSLSAPTTAGLNEYKKRLSKSCQFSWSVGEKQQLPGERSKSQVIRLDRTGANLTSPQLAQHIQLWASQGKSQLVWLVGEFPEKADADSDADPVSSESLSDEFSLALSPLALSLNVAGLLLAEQIYRAFRILENQPYHK